MAALAFRFPTRGPGWLGAVAGLAAVAAPHPGQAQSQAQSQDQPQTLPSVDRSRGQWLLAPYAFGVGVKGTVSAGALSAPIDLRVEDLARHVQRGGMGYVQYRRGEVFAYGEGIALNYHDDSFDQLFDADVRASVVLAETGLGRAFQVSGAPGAEVRGAEVSLYAGVRFTRIEATIALGGQVAQAEANWTDPVAGLIGQYPLNARWTLLGKIDAAGFGLDNSRYWSAAVMIEHELRPGLSLTAGYRVAAEHRASPQDSLALDVNGGGPQIGLIWRLGTTSP